MNVHNNGLHIQICWYLKNRKLCQNIIRRCTTTTTTPPPPSNKNLERRGTAISIQTEHDTFKILCKNTINNWQEVLNSIKLTNVWKYRFYFYFISFLNVYYIEFHLKNYCKVCSNLIILKYVCYCLIIYSKVAAINANCQKTKTTISVPFEWWRSQGSVKNSMWFSGCKSWHQTIDKRHL